MTRKLFFGSLSAILLSCCVLGGEFGVEAILANKPVQPGQQPGQPGQPGQPVQNPKKPQAAAKSSPVVSTDGMGAGLLLGGLQQLFGGSTFIWTSAISAAPVLLSKVVDKREAIEDSLRNNLPKVGSFFKGLLDPTNWTAMRDQISDLPSKVKTADLINLPVSIGQSMLQFYQKPENRKLASMVFGFAFQAVSNKMLTGMLLPKQTGSFISADTLKSAASLIGAVTSFSAGAAILEGKYRGVVEGGAYGHVKALTSDFASRMQEGVSNSMKRVTGGDQGPQIVKPNTNGPSMHDPVMGNATKFSRNGGFDPAQNDGGKKNPA